MIQSLVIMEGPAMPEAWWGYIIAVAVLAGPISGVLAWAAKLRWSKEFGAAKDAQIASLQAQITTLTNAHTELIKAKDAHIVFLEREIKSLQELNPTKLREYVQSIKQGLEEYNDLLKQKIKEKDGAIEELELRGQSHLMAFTQLTQEKENLESQMLHLKEQIGLSRGEFLSRLSEVDIDIATSLLSRLRSPGNSDWHIGGRSFIVDPTPFMQQGLGALDASPQEEDQSP